MSEYKKIVAKNKRAQFEYFIEEYIEAGIVLKGSEVKSIRAGKVALADSHAATSEGELFLYNCHIAEYAHANRLNHATRRPRKLLLHKREIQKIFGKIKLKGYTLVALSMYFNRKNMDLQKVKNSMIKGKQSRRKTGKESKGV